jgi:hypothetical protein
MAPVFFGHAPGLSRVLLQLAEAGGLLLLAEVHPELEDQRAVLAERPLERDDPVQTMIVLGHVDPSESPLQQRLRVPGPEEDPDMSVRGEIPPEAPVFGPLVLLLAGSVVGMRDDPAWIHEVAEPSRGLALPTLVDPAEYDEHREVLIPEVGLCLQQALPESRHSIRVLAIGNGQAQLGGFKH